MHRRVQAVESPRAHQSAAVVVSRIWGFLRCDRLDWGRLARLGAGACLLSGGLALGQAATTVIVPPGPLLPQKIGAWELEATAPGCCGLLPRRRGSASRAPGRRPAPRSAPHLPQARSRTGAGRSRPAVRRRHRRRLRLHLSPHARDAHRLRRRPCRQG